MLLVYFKGFKGSVRLPRSLMNTVQNQPGVVNNKLIMRVDVLKNLGHFVKRKLYNFRDLGRYPQNFKE